MISDTDSKQNETQPLSLSSCLPRFLLFFFVLIICTIAALFLYFVWQGSLISGGREIEGVNTALNPIERIYLRGLLAANADKLNQPVSSGNEPVNFTIQMGQSAEEIARNLARADLLNDTTLFINYLKYHGLDSQLVAGTFEINPGSTIPMLANTLIQSTPQSIDLTFLEGWRTEEMADYLSAVQPANIDPEEFKRLALQNASSFSSDFEFLALLPTDASLEGFLFPDTYSVPIDADAKYLISLMLENFNRQVSPSLRQSFGVQGYSVFEALTLASIVQREAQIPEEQPIMVSVYTNRLNSGMLLQADPTVQYALGFQPDSGSWWKSPLSLDDLEIDSPYNTYQYFGLPPGPINSPGLNALEAVALPDETDYLFFVAGCSEDPPKSHVFSLTFEQHLSNVERCRQ